MPPEPQPSEKALVTGATGFIGSELTRQLLIRGCEVRILRRETSKLDLIADFADKVEHAVGDVTDPESITPAFDGITHVYHTAAYIGFGGKRDEGDLFTVNVDGTANVVNAALKAGVIRMVHTSSIAALGRIERSRQIIDESAEWLPSRANSAYARSKHLAELEIHRGIAEGLDAVMVNPSLVFGPGRGGENTAQIVEKVRRRSLPAVPAGGTNVVDVADAATGHILAMQHGKTGERYILGSENLAWKNIIFTLANAFGVKPPRLVLPYSLAMGAALGSEALAWLTRTKPLLTRENARTSSFFYRYSNARAVEQLGCSFRPFRETAARIARVMEG